MAMPTTLVTCMSRPECAANVAKGKADGNGDADGDANGSVFAQRAHSAGTAPIITLFIPGTSLKTIHLQKRA